MESNINILEEETIIPADELAYLQLLINLEDDTEILIEVEYGLDIPDDIILESLPGIEEEGTESSDPDNIKRCPKCEKPYIRVSAYEKHVAKCEKDEESIDSEKQKSKLISQIVHNRQLDCSICPKILDCFSRAGVKRESNQISGLFR